MYKGISILDGPVMTKQSQYHPSTDYAPTPEGLPDDKLDEHRGLS